MRKGILIAALSLVSIIGLNSCHKCYKCSQTTHETLNNVVDSAVFLQTEICNGKNGVGPNLNSTVADVESTGYICVQE